MAAEEIIHHQAEVGGGNPPPPAGGNPPPAGGGGNPPLDDGGEPPPLDDGGGEPPEVSPLQAMLDAEDEKFGTSDYDPEYREALARDLAKEQASEQEPDRAAELDNSIHGYEQYIEQLDDDDPQKAELEKELENMKAERAALMGGEAEQAQKEWTNEEIDREIAREKEEEALRKIEEAKEAERDQWRIAHGLPPKNPQAQQQAQQAQQAVGTSQVRALHARNEQRRQKSQEEIQKEVDQVKKAGYKRARRVLAARAVTGIGRLVGRGAAGVVGAGFGAVLTIGSGHAEHLFKNVAAGGAAGVALEAAATGAARGVGDFVGHGLIGDPYKEYQTGRKKAVAELGDDALREYYKQELPDNDNFKEHMANYENVVNPGESKEFYEQHKQELINYASETGVGLTGNRSQLSMVENAMKEEQRLLAEQANQPDESRRLSPETISQRTKNALTEASGYSRKDFRKDRKAIEESLVKSLKEHFMDPEGAGLPEAEAEELAKERIKEKMDLMEKMYR